MKDPPLEFKFTRFLVYTPSLRHSCGWKIAALEEVWRQVTDFNANQPSSSTEIQRTRRLKGKATAQKLYLKTVNESKLKSS
jgi:hypothetical protein